jgi:hypothetical protein
VLAAARRDPAGLVRALDQTTIDEVQLVPDLFSGPSRSQSMMIAGPARFLLTGSAITYLEVMMVLTSKRYASCRRNRRPKNHNELRIQFFEK